MPDHKLPAQQILDLGHRPALGRADFLVSASNREALLWIERWPEWPAHALAISGPAGCGKSHLAAIWSARADADLVAPHDVDGRGAAHWLARRRNIVIENASILAGQGGFEQALFHLYNGLKEISCSLLLTDAVPPARWPVALPDLKSRLSAIPAIAVAAPDDDLLRALFGKLFTDRQIRVSPEVISYLIPRMERSFAAVSRLVTRLDEMALSQGGAITIAAARMALDSDPTE